MYDNRWMEIGLLTESNLSTLNCVENVSTAFLPWENTEVRNCKTCTKKWPKSQRNKNQWLFFLLLLLSSCCSAILSYYEKGENIKLVIGIQIIQWMCMYIIFFFFFTQVRNQILRLVCWLKCQHFIWKSESKIGQKVDLMLHCIIKSNVLKSAQNNWL